EVSEADGDVHRGDDQLGDLLEPFDVEGALVVQELQQVDAGQVAGRVVKVDVLTAVCHHGATHDVGVVPWLREVISGLETRALPAYQSDGPVHVVEPGRLHDLVEPVTLAREGEPDQPVEFPDAASDDTQVVGRPGRTVADLAAVLPGVAE